MFKDNAVKFLEDFLAAVPKSKDLTSKDALAQLRATREKLKKMRDAEQNIINGLNVFNLRFGFYTIYCWSCIQTCQSEDIMQLSYNFFLFRCVLKKINLILYIDCAEAI